MHIKRTANVFNRNIVPTNAKILFRADDIMPEDILTSCVHLRIVKCKVIILNGTKYTDCEKRT